MVSQIPISSSQLASQQVVGYKRPSQQVSASPQTKVGIQGLGLGSNVNTQSHNKDYRMCAINVLCFLDY